MVFVCATNHRIPIRQSPQFHLRRALCRPRVLKYLRARENQCDYPSIGRSFQPSLLCHTCPRVTSDHRIDYGNGRESLIPLHSQAPNKEALVQYTRGPIVPYCVAFDPYAPPRPGESSYKRAQAALCCVRPMAASETPRYSVNKQPIPASARSPRMASSILWRTGISEWPTRASRPAAEDSFARVKLAYLPFARRR